MSLGNEQILFLSQLAQRLWIVVVVDGKIPFISDTQRHGGTIRSLPHGSGSLYLLLIPHCYYSPLKVGLAGLVCGDAEQVPAVH